MHHPFALPQLAALRDTYLLGSPLLEPFVSFLLRSIRWVSGAQGALLVAAFHCRTLCCLLA